MSRNAKIIIFSLVLVFSIYQKQSSSDENNFEENNNEIVSTPNSLNNLIESIDKKDDDIIKPFDNDIPEIQLIDPDLDNKTIYPTPNNGFSPYDQYFGKGVYNNSSGNEFVIKNSNNTHAVVLLVNAYSGKKIRNEFVRKGTNFSMTGVPNGTYYLEWFSGDDWSPNYKIGNYLGGFQTDASFTKTRDASDWMAVSGYQQWTVTLYSVVGGDVESESINANEFFN